MKIRKNRCNIIMTVLLSCFHDSNNTNSCILYTLDLFNYVLRKTIVVSYSSQILI